MIHVIEDLFIYFFFFFFLSRALQVTSTASDPELGFTIISCIISTNSNPSVSSNYTLIETVCPTDDSIKYYPQRDFPVSYTQAEKKSFSFTFNSKLNMSLLFLHCEMSLCSKRYQSNHLPLVRTTIFSKLLLFLCLMILLYKPSIVLCVCLCVVLAVFV